MDKGFCSRLVLLVWESPCPKKSHPQLTFQKSSKKQQPSYEP